MASRPEEFASLRLGTDLKKQVLKIAASEKRTLSQMLRILIEEALQDRQKVR